MRLRGTLAALMALHACPAGSMAATRALAVQGLGSQGLGALTVSSGVIPVLRADAVAGKAWAPVQIGRYGAWQAAIHQGSGQEGAGTVCYALTYATSSQPLFQGRGHVVLTVAMRPHDRDAVAILLGYSVLPHAGASVLAGGKRLHFYLEGRSAFAPHGHEAIEAFAAGKQAVGSFPGPRGLTLTDVFSLDGFAAAYAAIVHACPGSP